MTWRITGTSHHGDISIRQEEMKDDQHHTVYRFTLAQVSDVANNPHEAKRRLADKLERAAQELRK